LWAAWIGLVAIKWDWFARRSVDRLQRDERLADNQDQRLAIVQRININPLLIRDRSKRHR
jgi:hypothetical protein